MMNIPVKVEGQTLRPEFLFSPLASGSKNFVKFVFDFSKDWYGLNIYAQIRGNGFADIEDTLGSDRVFALPSTVKPGKCMLSLVGKDNGENTVATTGWLLFTIEDCGYIL